MKAVAAVLAIVAAALAVCAAAVFGAGDRGTLVSPPEAIAEDFFRAVWMKRFPQARKYLASDAKAEIDEEDLSALRGRLEAEVGGIEDVRGEAGAIAGDVAEAGAEIRGREKTTRVRLRFARETGEWRMSGLSGPTP